MNRNLDRFDLEAAAEGNALRHARQIIGKPKAKGKRCGPGAKMQYRRTEVDPRNPIAREVWITGRRKRRAA